MGKYVDKSNLSKNFEKFYLQVVKPFVKKYIEKETDLVDFSDYDDYQEPNFEIIMSYSDGMMILSEDSNADYDGERLIVDDIPLALKDSYLSSELDNLADTYEVGEGLTIENGVISLV